MKYSLLILSFFLCVSSIAQSDSTALPPGSAIKIAVKNAPPFVFVDQTGIHGPIIDFWENLNEELNWESEYVIFESVDEVLSAVELGDVHMSINPITVTSSRLNRVHFTQPFYITDTTILRKKTNSYWSFIKGMFSWQFISAIIGLGVIILFFGLIVWFIEHRKNKEFRKGYKGIGDGFWWSAVTMTTVGYGDKAPKTAAGRIVAFIWMMAAIIGISGLTAGIASSLTTQNLKSEIHSVRDLRNYDLVTMKGTSTDSYLASFNIPVQHVESLDEGFEMIEKGSAEMFIYDRILLKAALSKSHLRKNLEIMKASIRTDYYSFPITRQFDVVDKVNPILVEELNGIDWVSIRDRYGINE